jgi:hypothetical protein
MGLTLGSVSQGQGEHRAASSFAGHHRGEDRAAEPVQLLGEGLASLGPDQEGTAAVGLVGFPAHQARLDGGGHSGLAREQVDATRRRLVDGVTREEYLATVEVLQCMTANLEGEGAPAAGEETSHPGLRRADDGRRRCAGSCGGVG